MTDREALIELLDEGLDRINRGTLDFMLEILADFLLANGVTFATDNNVGCKWIPVTERLPEVGRRVLVTNGKHVSFGYNLLGGEGNLWCVQFPCNDDDVTHWMPLPEPPKEEV